MVIETLNSSFTIIIFITLLGSIINLYYYLNLTFISVLTLKTPALIYRTTPVYIISLFLPLVATMSLGLGPILFILIYALTLFYKS
jgi:hypothetical protein